MHSRVFVICNKKEEIEDFKNSSIEEEILNGVIGADYAQKQEEYENFKEDVEWFSQYYKTPAEIKREEDGVFYAEVDANAFYEALQREKKKRIERIRKLLKAPDPDLYNLAQTAYYEKSFFFVLNGIDVVPEVDTYLFEFLEDTIKKGGKIYIATTWDYHF